MPNVNLILKGDGCWPDLTELRDRGMVIETRPSFAMALLEGGMESGAPSVTFRFDLPDGRAVLTQTSFALLRNCVRAMEVRLGMREPGEP